MSVSKNTLAVRLYISHYLFGHVRDFPTIKTHPWRQTKKSTLRMPFKSLKICNHSNFSLFFAIFAIRFINLFPWFRKGFIKNNIRYTAWILSALTSLLVYTSITQTIYWHRVIPPTLGWIWFTHNILPHPYLGKTIDYASKSFIPILNYISLKLLLISCFHFLGFIPILNYISLKPFDLQTLLCFRFTPILNYIALKLVK